MPLPPDHSLWCDARASLDPVHLEKSLSRLESGTLGKSLSQFAIGNPPDFSFITERLWDAFLVDDDCTCSTFANHSPKRRSRIVVPEKPVAEGATGTVKILSSGTGVTAVLKETKTKVPLALPPIVAVKFSEGAAEMNPANSPPSYLLTDSSGTSHILAVPTHNFINQTLVSFFIARALRETGFSQGAVTQFDAFVCGGQGFALLETADAGDLADYIASFEGDVAPEIERAMDSVFATLRLLKQPRHGFVHADLKAKNVFASRSGPNGKVEFKIADFDKSSISFNGVRFHTRGPKALSLFDPNPFPLQTESSGEQFYVLTSLAASIASKFGRAAQRRAASTVLSYTMFSPFAFYSTYDYYTFVLSLALEPRGAEIILAHYLAERESATPPSSGARFYSTFKSMWFASDFDKLVSEIADKQARHAASPTKTSLASLRSITTINATLVKLGLRLKRAFYTVQKSTRASPPRRGKD